MIWVWLRFAFRFLAGLIVPPIDGKSHERKIALDCQCPACGHRKKRCHEFTRADIDKEGERAVIKMVCATCNFEWFEPVIGRAKWPAK